MPGMEAISMPASFWALLFFLALGVGFCSGVLGIGGGILLVPALLYIPVLAGVPSMDMKTIAGLTMVQGFAASCAGILGHRKDRHVCRRLVRHMGPAMVAGSAAGAVLSAHVSPRILLAMFAALALAAAALMFLPKADGDGSADPDGITYPVPLAVVVPFLLGGLLGMVGQGLPASSAGRPCGSGTASSSGEHGLSCMKLEAFDKEQPSKQPDA